MLFEHAAHPVLTINGGGLSADYPGHAIKRINKKPGTEAAIKTAVESLWTNDSGRIERDLH